ncbi:hypothetical protein INT45_008997 [Circinella minor]|uniref:Uncharacterized protein n=1 Tax=Circinella minor TaxID=1195481 RepID=A0A8H7VJZ0_9FUNG|nr:hypothetical protein INT45_008997 [Circinella minor]
MSKEALDEFKIDTLAFYTAETFSNKNNYEKVIESGKVWKLKSGLIVEQVMMDYSLGLKYEQASNFYLTDLFDTFEQKPLLSLAHSLILNPDDPLYADVFTEQELNEIGDFNSIDFNQELPNLVH